MTARALATKHRPRPRRERDVQAAIFAWLEQMPGLYWRNNTGAVKTGRRFVRFGVKGLPDILGVVPPDGRLVAIECKREGERLSPRQDSVLKALRMAGALVIVATEVSDVATVLAALR